MRNALYCVAALATAAPALASGEGGTPSPFAGDIGNALWTLVIFIIVVLVLGKFAWGPILNALKQREDFIHDSLTQAKKDREEAEVKLKEYVDKVEAAHAEATAIVEEGKRDGDALRRKIEETARNEAQTSIERSRREIALATDTAVKELYDLSGKLATDIAARIIKEELDAARHQRLIAESIEDLTKTVKGG